MGHIQVKTANDALYKLLLLCDHYNEIIETAQYFSVQLSFHRAHVVPHTIISIQM